MAQAQGLIYAVMGNGELRWFRHLGRGMAPATGRVRSRSAPAGKTSGTRSPADDGLSLAEGHRHGVRALGVVLAVLSC